MAKRNPSDVIETYRQKQKHKSVFTFAEISKGALLLIMLAASMYVIFAGTPELPTLIELKTNTPTFTPSITPQPTQTQTEIPNPENQCACASPEVLVMVITATQIDTNTQAPQLSTETVTAKTPFSQTQTPIPSNTSTPSLTNTPTISATPTQTQIIYIVKSGDTLGAIALKFNQTVEAIQLANNLDTTLIYEGQILQIPKP